MSDKDSARLHAMRRWLKEPWSGTNHRLVAFQDGFDAGWDAAKKLIMARLDAYQQEVAPLGVDLDIDEVKK